MIQGYIIKCHLYRCSVVATERDHDATGCREYDSRSQQTRLSLPTRANQSKAGEIKTKIARITVPRCTD